MGLGGQLLVNLFNFVGVERTFGVVSCYIAEVRLPIIK